MTRCGHATPIESLEPRRLFAVPRTMLDPAFGARGLASMNVSNEHEYAWDLAVQSDGSTLTLLTTGDAQSVLLRHGPDGRPDAGFGDIGRVLLTTGDGVEWLDAVAVAPDGRIVLAGIPYQSRGAVNVPFPQPDAVV